MIDRFFEWIEGVPLDEKPRKSGLFDLQRKRTPRWDDDEVLFYFRGSAMHGPNSFTHNVQQPFRLANAYEGVQGTGSTGSGKTSGSGRQLAHAYLRAGMGGLVLCHKKDEVDLWHRYAEASGRGDDLIEFGSTEGQGFPALNFLDYELQRAGKGAGQTENIINLFYVLSEIAERKKSGTSPSSDYFERAVKAMTRSAIEILRLATGRISLLEIDNIIATAPMNLKNAGDDSEKGWQSRSVCWAYIQDAAKNAEGDPDKMYEFERAQRFFLLEFPTIAADERSGIIGLFRGISDGFLRGHFRKLFCGETTVVPEMMQLGKIIIINLPEKEWGEIGKFANCLWYYMTMKSIERRPDKGSPEARPVFIWADEAHNFVMEYSMHFQTSARDCRACTVMLSQNINNYYNELGPGKVAAVKSLLANMNTKIFHCNDDETTNEWAANLIGKKRMFLTNIGESQGKGQRGTSFNMNQTVDYAYPPWTFKNLKKGGAIHNCKVEAVVHMNGVQIAGENAMYAVFDQRADL